MAGWYRKGSVPKREEGRAQREARRERERERERDKRDQDERVEGGNGSIPEWRDGTVQGRSPGGKRDESREKKEERRGKSAERSEKRERQARAR